MSKKRIVRRVAERQKGRTDWARLRSMTEKEVERAAANDADNPAWTADELAAAQLVLPSSAGKIPVSIRLDADVLDYFKGQGRGYQSRINAVLRAYVRGGIRQRDTGG